MLWEVEESTQSTNELTILCRVAPVILWKGHQFTYLGVRGTWMSAVSALTHKWLSWWERPACSWCNVPSVFQPSPWVTVRWLLWHLANNKASAKAPAGPINRSVTARHSIRTFYFSCSAFTDFLQKAFWYNPVCQSVRLTSKVFFLFRFP